MVIYYRISNNSYNKPKLSNLTKENCLLNAIKHFYDNVSKFYIIGDNVTETSLKEFLDDLPGKLNKISVEYTSLGNSGSFRYIYNLAMSQNLPEETIYFLEDDYVHKDNSYNMMLEGLKLGDYVTLYDHPDMYHNTADGGDNPFIEQGGEVTRVLKGDTSHWKISMSTTMTFATTVKVLMEDIEIWDKHSRFDAPTDFYGFLELRDKGRKLVLPLPGYSTHACIGYLTPFHDWEKELIK